MMCGKGRYMRSLLTSMAALFLSRRASIRRMAAFTDSCDAAALCLPKTDETSVEDEHGQVTLSSVAIYATRE